MPDILDISSVIDDEEAVSSFTSLLGQPLGVADPRDDVMCYGDPDISWIDLHIKKKEFSFKFRSSELICKVGNYLFFAYFINQLSDRNIPFFFIEDTISYETVADVNYIIVLHNCVYFRFEVDSNVLMLKRISISKKFVANRYLQFDIQGRYSSVG
jgi:hypothetical protein